MIFFRKPVPTFRDHALAGRDAELLTVVGQPGLAPGPIVHAAARRTNHPGLHDRELFDVAHLDAGGDVAAGRRTADHDDSHDPSSLQLWRGLAHGRVSRV